MTKHDDNYPLGTDNDAIERRHHEEQRDARGRSAWLPLAVLLCALFWVAVIRALLV